MNEPMEYMKYYDTINDLPDLEQGAVLVIGNFDGVHCGHQELLRIAQNIAEKQKVALAVLTFEPHPRHLFRPDDPPFRITSAAAKRRRLERCGVDIMFSLSFDWDFASQSADHFIQTILKEAIRPTHIVVGNDFCFGQLRKGTPQTLLDAGLAVTVIDKIADEGDADISSSNIRQALRHGDIDRANKLLGWKWEIEGTIVKGDQRGRTLGYPTANVHLGETLHPAYGIYASWAKIVEDGPESPWLPSATNIGIRPMFEVPVGQVETYIFDFDRDIYDKTLRVRPLQKLRGEAKFESLEALVAQIAEDCEQAQAVLQTSSS